MEEDGEGLRSEQGRQVSQGELKLQNPLIST